MPQVQDQVEDLTGQEPKKNVNPDEAVALGAAIQGGVLSGDVDDIVLLDVTPLSLGVEVKGGLFERLIEKNTTIPTEESKIFTTAGANQTQVQIRVFQGEREIAAENELLGEFALSGIPPAPAGTPRSRCRSTSTRTASSTSGPRTRDRVTPKKSLSRAAPASDDQIDQMQEEAEQHAEEDEERRERIEARNEAEASVRRRRDPHRGERRERRRGPHRRHRRSHRRRPGDPRRRRRRHGGLRGGHRSPHRTASGDRQADVPGSRPPRALRAPVRALLVPAVWAAWAAPVPAVRRAPAVRPARARSTWTPTSKTSTRTTTSNTRSRPRRLDRRTQ